MAATREKLRGNAAKLARLCGVDQSTAARWKQHTDFPPIDDAGEFALADAIEWRVRRQISTDVESDLMQGSESEGLERYRLARAQQEEIKLAQQRGQVILLNDFEEVCQAILSPYRRLAEHVKHRSDSELWAMIEECNELVLAGLERLYSPKSEGG